MQTLTMNEAANILNHCRLLIYPTETYFGIGCKAHCDEAISRIFKVKKRLYAMPLPIIIASREQAEMVAAIPGYMEEDLERLAAEFWPGPLSVILPARAHLSPLLTGGTGKVAMRVSPHPVPGKLAELVGEPIVASSANISGQSPVTSATELNPELIQGVEGVLDLPPVPAGGAPSTLVEPLGGRKILVHRLGAVSGPRLDAAGFIQERK